MDTRWRRFSVGCKGLSGWKVRKDQGCRCRPEGALYFLTNNRDGRGTRETATTRYTASSEITRILKTRNRDPEIRHGRDLGVPFILRSFGFREAQHFAFSVPSESRPHTQPHPLHLQTQQEHYPWCIHHPTMMMLNQASHHFFVCIKVRTSLLILPMRRL